MEITGTTYSVSDYQNYNQHGDVNYFEEVIDKLMLDKYSDDPELKEYISSLPLDKKRMAILSLLGGDNNLWTKIKALTDKNINKMDHIKDIILMLREYVKVGEVEKKKFGEVMTPLELVKEMLATLPEEVWSNPNLKFLDPANGTGPYPIMVIYKLMKGLESWEPDEEKRYKHIVENMIYVCELQPKNMFLYMCAVDPFDTYKLNIYTGSFLESQFDKHMKDVWGIDKFDIILGNPPYQETSESNLKSSDQGKIKLWMKFVDKCLLKCDYLLFVTPNNWLSKTCHLNEVFKDKIICSQIDSDYLQGKYFSSVGSTFSYYLLKNDSSEKNPYFLLGDDIIDFNILKMEVLPTKEINKVSISIFTKALSINKRVTFTREKYHLITNNDLLISIDRSKNKGFVEYSPNITNTSSYWLICDSIEQKNILLNNLNSKVYKFMIKNLRSGMAVVSTINNLPIIDNHAFDDDDLYKYLGLTSEEIKFLEK